MLGKSIREVSSCFGMQRIETTVIQMRQPGRDKVKKKVILLWFSFVTNSIPSNVVGFKAGEHCKGIIQINWRVIQCLSGVQKLNRQSFYPGQCYIAKSRSRNVPEGSLGLALTSIYLNFSVSNIEIESNKCCIWTSCHISSFM